MYLVVNNVRELCGLHIGRNICDKDLQIQESQILWKNKYLKSSKTLWCQYRILVDYGISDKCEATEAISYGRDLYDQNQQ